MPAPSLSVLAGKECLKNYKAIMQLGDVGEVPYHLVRDILLRVEDPKKLREIEILSPQICGPDGELWLGFIKRDVPNWDKKPHEPKNPQNWYKVYRKLLQESEREIERDAELLRATMAGIKSEADKHKARQVELAHVRVPPGVTRLGPTIYAKCDLRERVRTIHNPNEVRKGSNLDAPSISRRETKPPKGKLDKFRKEARAAAHFQQQSKPSGKAVWTPQEMKSKLAPINKTSVTAPSSMIEDYRRPADWKPHDPTIKPPTIFAPRKRRIEHDDTPQAKKAKTSDNEEREKRLKVFTNPSITTKSATTLGTGSNPSSAPTTVATSRTGIPSKSAPTASASQPRPSKQETAIASEVISEALAITNTPSLQKPTSRPSRGISSTISRAATTSPSSGEGPPQKVIRRKAPVDIFMRPKRPKLS